MINVYWPVFKNLESELVGLTYNIHIDDSQLNVYSSKISDLILRASAEIESISKELYKLNGGTKTKNIKFDFDALEHLDDIWKIEQKVVIISSFNCFQTKKELFPFKKNEFKTSNNKPTYSWNNSYQNLKHDRANSIQFGNIGYLFDIMSALFILNIYFKSETFDLEKNSKATDFPINLGSDLFSIKLHKWFSYDGAGIYGKKEDFDECLYLTKMTEKSRELNDEHNKKIHAKNMELLIKHPKFIKYINENDIQEYKGNNLMYDVLGKEDHLTMLKQSYSGNTSIFNATEYEAAINKNNI